MIAILDEQEFQLTVRRNWDFSLKSPDPFKTFRELQEAIVGTKSPVDEISGHPNEDWYRAE